MTLKVPPAQGARLRAVAEAAGDQPVYAVGGCVRDWLLGRPTKDLDVAAVGVAGPLAAALAKRFGGTAEAFDAFGTSRISLKGGGRIDVARARRETYPAPAALPVVVPADSIGEDLFRRDFTVNAMAVRLLPKGLGGLEDPWGGAADLAAGRLRVLHPASFRDDPTRVFRGARFLCRFGFALEDGTEHALLDAVAAGHPYLLSRERLRQELIRVLEEKDPRCALERLKGWNVHTAFYHRFSWPDGVAAEVPTPARLGLLALHLGGGDRTRAEGFLDSLRLERSASLALKAAVEAWHEKASPRSRLPAAADKALEALGVPAYARRPLLVTGKDLVRLGMKPGKLFGRMLEHAARAQWGGQFTSRSQALVWLRRETGAVASSSKNG